ncbi:MAG: HupE/UreJ family protein [Methylococcales bacterium]|nr:HupE/UreJ family protein [Methylococcales bacterium]
MKINKIVLMLLLLGSATPVLAHTGLGTTHGFVAGFTHPLQGIDHLLVMFAIGLWGCILGGKQVWVLPLSFLVLMAVGAGLSFVGVKLPYVELLITGSVLIFGVIIGFNWQVSATFSMVLVAAAGLCHGYVHAAEITIDATQSDYALGFLCATACVQSLGITASLLGKKALQALQIGFGLTATAAVIILLAA